MSEYSRFIWERVTNMAEEKICLELKDINTYYGFSHVLYDVSLKIPQGKVVALLGRNGVGKTTTIRSIMGLTPPASGEVIYNGEAIQTKPAFKISQMGVGIVPQGRRLFKSLTVKEHLEVYCRGSKAWTPEKALEWVDEKMIPHYPLGVYKDKSTEKEEA